MAQENHYPSVVLLDNENNPITPLVDITSIYIDPRSKEDAGVIGSPIQFEDVDDKISQIDGEIVDENGEPLYIVVGAKVVDHILTLQRVKASSLLGEFVNRQIWDVLQTRDGLDIEDADGELLEVKRF